MVNPYEIAHNQSMEDPNGFWGAAAEDCHWYKKWDKVLDDTNKPFFRWFSGGEMNTCYNAVDYHIEHITSCGMRWLSLPALWPPRAYPKVIGS